MGCSSAYGAWIPVPPWCRTLGRRTSPTAWVVDRTVGRARPILGAIRLTTGPLRPSEGHTRPLRPSTAVLPLMPPAPRPAVLAVGRPPPAPPPPTPAAGPPPGKNP